MTCYAPIQGYKSKFLTKNGKRSVVFHPNDALGTCKLFQVTLPCGQCVGCRLEYSRQWAIRCMHESQMHSESCFITLTYNDKFLPRYGSLDYDHWTKFMKRLRKKFSDIKVRFFMGPEYGEKSHRPHYHALLFGLDFSDKQLFSIRNGYRLYVSEILNSLWSCPKTSESYGFASVGSVTFESAAYVARYMMKKVKGEDHVLRYFAKCNGHTDINVETGEIFPIAKERARMSRMPGIAKDWYDKFGNTDCHNHDFVVLGTKKVRPPRYYDNILKNIDPSVYESIKEQRVIDSKKFKDNNTPDRLEVRRICKEESLLKLVRVLD